MGPLDILLMKPVRQRCVSGCIHQVLKRLGSDSQTKNLRLEARFLLPERLRKKSARSDVTNCLRLSYSLNSLNKNSFKGGYIGDSMRLS